jgi:zinc protease
VLPNRLTVLTKEIHDKPIVATMIWYRVGSRNEEVGQTGKSHFLEHMLFKGTGRYRKGEIDLITLKNGGANNAFTWLDFTAYYFTFASDRWQVALEIESDRMRNTLFDEQEFEAEKRVVEEELRMGLDDPWSALEQEVWATAFRQHPYRWPTVGWMEDLQAATLADMKDYYDRWYHPRNAVLVIVGDFDREAALARVEELFGPIPPGPEPKPLRIVEPKQRGEKRLLVKKATPVERLMIGYHAPAVSDPDSYAMHILAAMLSTGKTSRLYRRLVERDQSVTLAKAYYHDHIDPPLIYIQAELKPGFKLEAVERAICEEIERVACEPPSDQELERAKRQIEAELVLSSEDFLEQAMLLGQYETICASENIPEDSRGYRFLDTLLERLKAVSASDLMRVAGKYLCEDNRTVGYLIDDGSGRHNIAESLSRHGPIHRSGGRAEPRPIAHRPRIDVERFQLENGLVVLLSENHSIPSVSISAFVCAGSRFEPDEKAGLASLVGEMLDEGTKERSAEQIAELVESVGGNLTTFGDYQWSGVQASFLSKDMRLALEITSDVLMNAIFPEDKVKQHIERRVAQIRSRLDIPRVLASDEFNKLIFGNHPAHRPPIGYEDTVKRLSPAELLDFHRRYYVPSNTLLAVVGDIDKREVKGLIEETFGRFEPAPWFRLPEVPPPRQDRPIERRIFVPKEQANIFIGHLGIRRADPDYYALLVMDTILGSSPGFTSRIPRVLRDELGLAYTTFSNITSSAGLDPGRFVAYMGTAPENVDRAIWGLRSEIERIVEEPVSEEELQSAKAYLTGSFVFNFQTNSQVGQFLIEAETYDLGYDYLERYPEIICSIAAEDVLRAAREHIDPERMTTVVVGPINGDKIC